MTIHAFHENDLSGGIECFTQSVRVIAARYYSADQIDVWAPFKADLYSWRQRLSSERVLVAEVYEAISGFVRMEHSGLVDLLYVHPSHERQGVGRGLLKAACSWAAAHGAKWFEANVSLAARQLF